MTTYFACGTSAGRSRKNQLIFAKISNVHRHKQKKNEDDISDSESDSSDSEDEDESKKEAKLPRLIKAEVPYKGGINKVRNLDQFTAVFGENKKVAIYDNTKAMEALNDIDKKKAWFFRVKQKKDPISPIQTFNHLDEGYALDWNRNNKKLLSADNKGQIHVWDVAETKWKPNQTPYLGHNGSVEDIHWQPQSDSTFVSVSSDKSIQVFDTRSGYSPIVSCFNAHDKDINVMSWSSANTNLITTGGDDCAVKIWDCRTLEKNKEKTDAIFSVKFHSKPITSIDFHPSEDGVLVTSGEDDQVCIWDCALEAEEVDKNLGTDGVPQQLLFIHAGHKEYKEVRWDRQKEGVLMSTSGSDYCFDIFKTISC